MRHFLTYSFLWIENSKEESKEKRMKYFVIHARMEYIGYSSLDQNQILLVELVEKNYCVSRRIS